MAGHSKWSNIKNRKGKTDAQRSKLFTKLGREIQVAVKSGGPDPQINSRLKDAIAKAKASNMPNDNIERSIKRASGEGRKEVLDEIIYEGYGPSGVAIMLETLTDNKNRTVGELRHFFDKFGGNLGATNSVSYMFDRKGLIVIEDKGNIDEDTLMMDVLEAGAEDFNPIESAYEIITDPNSFTAVREHLEEKGYEFVEASLTMIPQNYVSLTDEEDIKNINKLFDALEDCDDVIETHHNYNEEE